MSETVLTLLVGGRGNLPNIWSVLEYKPTTVYVLAPAGDDANRRALCAWLEGRGVRHEVLPVDAYDCVAAEAACAAIIARHAEAGSVLFNMTQAPKLMAIGAANACVISRRAEVCAFHRETSSGKTHTAWGSLPRVAQPSALSVDDYFLAYGRRAFDRFLPEQLPCSFADLETIARNFAFDLRAFTSLMAYLKKPENLRVQNAILRAAPGPGDWSDAWDPLLTRMARFGLVRDLATDGPNRGFQLADTHVWSFLSGTWLEVYARSCATKSVDPQTDEPMFSDCRMGVVIDQDDVSNEIDLAAVDSAGLLLFASCKAGKNFDTRSLNEIVDRSSLFGHGYCAKALITSRSSGDIGQIPGMLEQAAARSVTIITGERLRTLSQDLAQIMLNARLRAR